MKVLSTESRLCECCMEEHAVQRIIVDEQNIYKGASLEYEAEYYYCDRADEVYADETMLAVNDISMKNSYRRANGLLMSHEIREIRLKYGLSQGDLCLLLGWGGKTVTRYEGHQVQDSAHDTILRKLGDDPEWFLELLSLAKERLSEGAYIKYKNAGERCYEENRDDYLKRAIHARYVGFSEKDEFTGGVRLSLDRVVDVIRYFANSPLVTGLYKVKLMKLLWYADALSYKRRGRAITGLVYRALPMGAVPICHDSIINLGGINYDEIDMGDGTAYRFTATDDRIYPDLSGEDIDILDAVIQSFGKATKAEIIDSMHNERAYMETAPRDVIKFRYALDLSIS